jgi:hypothetical protein
MLTVNQQLVLLSKENDRECGTHDSDDLNNHLQWSSFSASTMILLTAVKAPPVIVTALVSPIVPSKLPIEVQKAR